MRVGDKVKVTKVLPCNLNSVSVGDKGVVADLGSNLVYVVLDKYSIVDPREFPFLFQDRSCQFSKGQVEVVDGRG